MAKTNKRIKNDNSKFIHQDSKIDFEFEIRERNDLTERQKLIIETILDKNTKIIFIDGPAGSSKTWLAVYCGLKLLNQKKLSHIIYTRSVIESASKSIGALPGELNDKFGPFIVPLLDKLDEFLSADKISQLQKENRIQARPINFLRGSSLNAKYLIADECQNMTYKELVTVLTRIGEYSKFVFIGDTFQSDLNGSSGFQSIFNVFNTEESFERGIFCLKLENEDIVRSGILRFIVERLEERDRYAIGRA